MTSESLLEARVTQLFDQSSEQVFDAWLSPDWIGRWMFGPTVRDEEIVRLELDPKVGGVFSFVVRRQGQEIDHVGEYFVIDRPRQLSFSWGIRDANAHSSRVSIDIVPHGSGCELTLVHTLHPDWADHVSRTQAGWTKMLNALAVALRTYHS